MLRKIISVSRLASWPVGQFKGRDYVLCILSAVLLILSFPNFNLWIFAWFGFVPLFFAIENKSKGKVFLLSYLTGVIFWAGIIYWLVHVTLPGTILLVLYLALYFALFGLIFCTYHPSPITHHLLFIPSIWVLLEYIRSHLFTGFPWALLGYSQYLNLPVIQIADITGAWGVSFLVMMVNLFIKEVIGKSAKKINLLPIPLLILSLGYGYCRLYLPPTTHYLTPLKVSVIQGNIPQELKWQADAKAYILQKYTRFTEEASLAGADLIIWPEASNPGLVGEDDLIFEDILNLAKKIKIPLLIGSVIRDKEKYFNSALLIDGCGRLVNRYDKLHLVPFGEYIPLKKILPFLETVVPIGDIDRGRVYTIFALPAPAIKSVRLADHSGEKFAVLICFEDLFPELSRQFAKSGAGFLVNITNDAWYKQTSAPYQHLQASVFRAVENRLYLARSANTGISGFINTDGRIISLVQEGGAKNIFIDGFCTENIAITEKPLSFYTRYGDVFIFVCFLFALYGIISLLKKKR